MLLCPLLIWIILGAPGLDPRGGGTGIVALIAASGVLCFLGALLAAAGVSDQMRRARALGYPRDVIADVVTDIDGHAAAMWTDANPDVREITRERMRTLRRHAAFLHAAAAVMPAPLLALGIMLSLRGAASFAALLAIVLLPTLAAAGTAALMRGYALLLAQWDRGSAVWDPAPVTVQDRARAWARRTGVPAARSRAGLGGVAIVFLTALLAIVVFLSTAALVTVTVAIGAGTRALEPLLLAMPVSAARQLTVELARAERLPADSGVSAEAAGVAMHHALFAGAQRAPAMQPVPPAIDRPWRQPATGPALSAQRVWRLVLADDAADNLLHDSQHPAVELLLSVARAPAADIVGGRWLPDASEPLGVALWDWRGNAAPLQHALVARAARSARDGRFADAEQQLRAMISFGFLLVDQSPSRADLVAGAAMVRSGHSLLGELRALRGDSALRNTLRAVDEARRGTIGTIGTHTVSRGDLRRIAAGETGAYAADRWQAALALALAERCTSFEAVLFGPDPVPQHYEEAARRSLVRHPSQERLFDFIFSTATDTAALPALPLPPRWAGTRVIRSLLGPRHARSLCYGMAAF